MAQPGISAVGVFIFSGAKSCFPLYLLGYGLRLAPAVPQKDAAAIKARVFVCTIARRHKVADNHIKSI